MARLRYNGLTSTLGASLTSGATSVTFGAALTHSGGTAVPTLSGSDYIPLTILASGGAVSEIVYLTAYTAGATTGTITRGQEGTTGVAHSSGDKVVHGATVADIASGGGAGMYLAATTGQSVAADTTITVDFDTSDHADAGFTVDLAANAITVATAGWYMVAGRARLTAATTGQFNIFAQTTTTGTTLLTGGDLTVGGSTYSNTLSCPVYLAAGTGVRLGGYNSVGSNSIKGSADGSETYLRVVKL